MTGVDDARARRQRRRRILRWIPSVIIAVGIIVVIVLTIGFNNSWWTQAHPVASAQQQFENQSTFSQAGIDYSGKEGLVKISLAPDRPTAHRLGLGSVGARTITYIVPVTVQVTGEGSSIRQTLTDRVRIESASGHIRAVDLIYDQSYSEMQQTALQLIGITGTASDQAAFTASVQATLNTSRDKSYAATYKSHYAGMTMTIEFAGTSGAPHLTVRLAAS
jgi:hypothetical protein